MSFALMLAAVSVPFLWEWAKPLWQNPPAVIPVDSVAITGAPALPAEPSLRLKAQEPAGAPTARAERKKAAPEALLPIPPESSPFPEVPEPEEIQKDNKQDIVGLKSPVSDVVLEPAVFPENEKVINTLPYSEPEIKKVQVESGALPPLAIIEAEVPPLLDYTGSKLVRTSLRFVNRSPGEFSGQLSVKPPKGVKSISGELIQVAMNEGDTLFVPVVFMMGGTVSAGDNQVSYTLRDNYERAVETGSSRIPVTEKVSLQLSLDQPLILVTDMNDSLTLSARVHNRGNTDQLVAVVMGLPLNRGGKSFYELHGEVKAGKDTLFSLKVRPADILWNENVVYVNISGLYGPEKQTFGNVSLGIQSVVSSGRFTDNSFSAAMLYDNQYVPEDISLSYRRFGKSAMYQVMGGGHMNLPVGNLALQGLVYKVEGQEELIALNTQLTYRYNNNSLSVGNVNEQLEYSTFGRGVKGVFSDKSGKNTVKVGVVDNQFNLFSGRALFENGYSVFVKDHIGAPNAQENVTLDYMFREDRWENAKHHMAGGEWKWTKQNNWRVLMRSHAALSDYREKNGAVPSGSAELQYNGSVNNNSVAGNFYYSTAFFPGNRRGTINLQQSYNRQLARGAGLRANAFWSNFAPKSYSYDMAVETSNGRAEGMYTFPRMGKVGVGLGYQYQTETGNFAYLSGSDLPQNRALTYAHRLVENFNWRGGRHYFHLGLENGIVKPFDKTGWEPQAKALFFYSVGRFNLNSTYQYGGYYLSEQNFAAQMEKVTRRVMANASWNQEFLRQDLLLNAGVNYSHDFIMGSTWSGSVNSRYRVNRNYSVFLNSVVYNYSYSKNISLSTYNSTMSNIEAGLTVHLNQSRPATGKKSKLTITAFYDKNSNNVRDPDETGAVDYMIFLGDKAFITDEKGEVSYSSLPFGTYTVKAGARAGWFHAENTFRVDGFKEKVEIPLKQAGSVRGSIRYAYDERTAKDFVPVLAGVTLRIFRNGELVQRAVTDNDGRFIVFLPNGEYQAEIETMALDGNASVQNKMQTFSVEAGHITTLEPFVVEVSSKKINIRQFTQLSP